MLTKLTAGMNFSTENQTKGSRQDSIAARARPSRCPERDQSQEGIPVTMQFAIRDWLKKKGRYCEDAERYQDQLLGDLEKVNTSY
jgi:hypothetical protein